MDDKAFLDLVSKVDGYDESFEVAKGFVDTGCYALNALISGSIFGGIPDGRVTGFAGDPASGKCAVGYEGIEVYVSEDDYEKLKSMLNL